MNRVEIIHYLGQRLFLSYAVLTNGTAATVTKSLPASFCIVEADSSLDKAPLLRGGSRECDIEHHHQSDIIGLGLEKPTKNVASPSNRRLHSNKMFQQSCASWRRVT